MRNRKSFLGGIVLLLLFGGSVLWAANGDTLTIGGAVPLVLDLTVTPNASADIIDLSSENAADATQDIAGISISTNSASGWELWVFSTNATGVETSRLMNADGNDISYNITYTSDATLASAVSDTAVPAAGLKVVDDPAVSANARTETGTLTIQYDKDTTYSAGYYSDLLTITLRAK